MQSRFLPWAGCTISDLELTLSSAQGEVPERVSRSWANPVLQKTHQHPGLLFPYPGHSALSETETISIQPHNRICTGVTGAVCLCRAGNSPVPHSGILHLPAGPCCPLPTADTSQWNPAHTWTLQVCGFWIQNSELATWAHRAAGPVIHRAALSQARQCHTVWSPPWEPEREGTAQGQLQQPLGCSCSPGKTDSHCLLHLPAAPGPLASKQSRLGLFKFSNYVDSFSSFELVYALTFVKEFPLRNNVDDSSRNRDPWPVGAQALFAVCLCLLEHSRNCSFQMPSLSFHMYIRVVILVHQELRAFHTWPAKIPLAKGEHSSLILPVQTDHFVLTLNLLTHCLFSCISRDTSI